MKEFPHSCRFCRKYYPSNDANNVMKGGGECWMWSRLKEGDSRGNSCEGFSQLEEATVAQRQMYAVRVEPSDDGFAMSLVDTFLHVRLMKTDCGTIHEGVSWLSSRMLWWSEYFGKCVRAMSPASRLSGAIRIYSRMENETLGNPRSEMRKRMNTLVRGFPRNIQLNFRFASEYGQKTVQIRIFNADNGEPQVMICNDSLEYVTVKEYCENPVSREMAHLILAEFTDFSKFMESFGKAVAKQC